VTLELFQYPGKRVLGLVTILITFGVVSAQTSWQNPLSKPVTLVLNEVDSESVLRALSIKSDVSIGFVQITEDRNHPRSVGISVRNGTVKDVLDEFVRNDPRYRWEMDLDVINVVPVSDSDPLAEAVVKDLNVFNVDGNEATWAITRSPEIVKVMKKMRVSRVTPQLLVGRPKDPARFSLNLQGLTVRRILNEMVGKDGYSFWTIYRYGDQQDHVEMLLS
jgi:hypothetical protein